MTTREQLFQEFREYKQLNETEQEVFWELNAGKTKKRTSEEKQVWQDTISDNLLEMKNLLLKIKEQLHTEPLLKAM